MRPHTSSTCGITRPRLILLPTAPVAQPQLNLRSLPMWNQSASIISKNRGCHGSDAPHIQPTPKIPAKSALRKLESTALSEPVIYRIQPYDAKYLALEPPLPRVMPLSEAECESLLCRLGLQTILLCRFILLLARLHITPGTDLDELNTQRHKW
jgi:hypothetical protein